MDKFEVLKQYFGHTEFRKGQSDIIDNILSGRDVLGIMPTGAGKSICYQVPALMLDGITIVISPLSILKYSDVRETAHTRSYMLPPKDLSQMNSSALRKTIKFLW